MRNFIISLLVLSLGLMPTYAGWLPLVLTPISLDGSAIGNSGSTGSTTVTLTTTQANDVIVVFVVTNFASSTTVSSPTLGTFALRATASPGSQPITEWYSVSVGILTSEVITISSSGGTFVTATAFAVHGAKTSAPFDLNGSLPATSTTDPVSVSTTSAPTMVIGGFRANVASTPAGTGYTVIQSNSFFALTEYQIVSSPQSGLSVTMGSGAGTSGGSIGDAIVQGSSIAENIPFDPPVGTFTPVNFKGVNLAGAENSYPAASQFTYAYPQNYELDYFASKGEGLIRLPVQIRRLQPLSFGPLDPTFRHDEPAVSGSSPGTQTNLVEIKRILDHAFAKNMYVVIDPHNGGYIHDTVSNTDLLIGVDAGGAEQLADWWGKIATKFQKYPNVIWGLMNEPNVQTAAQWKSGVIPSITAIAAITKSQYVFIPGTSFTGGHSWTSSGNSVAWAGYVPPVGLPIAFEMHEYLDSDFSGTHAACAGNGSSPMTAATSWANTNGFKIWIGETGWSTDVTCPSDAATLMGYFTSNEPTYLGWAYWLGGAASFYSAYIYTIVPGGYPIGPFTDQPQMTILSANLN